MRSRVVATLVTASLAISLFATATTAHAADGDLDVGFVGGIVTASFGPSLDFGQSVVVQPDGKVVVAGYSPNFSVGQQAGPNDRISMAVARFNTDGTPDSGFGTSGKALASLGTDFRAFDIALQPDGKIVAVGASGTHVAVARFTASGQVDVSFGANGLLDIPLATLFAWGEAVVIQPDGKIVVAGEAVNGSGQNLSFSFVVMRFGPTGIFDPSFGANGIVTTPAEGATVSEMVLQRDGRLVVSGSAKGTRNGGATDGVLLRYDPNGSLDPTFGGTGRVGIALGNSSSFAGVAVQGDGRIVAAGETSLGTRQDIVVARFTPTGTPDPTFDGDGILTTQLSPASAVGVDVAVQPDDRIVAAAYAYSGPLGAVALVRYEVDGRLDPTFGTSGVARAEVTGKDAVPNSMAIAPDGSLAVAGTLYVDSTHALMLATRFVDRYARLTPSAPVRVLDTRSGPRPGAGTVVRVASGTPAGTSAVLVNLTVTDAQADGYVTADRCSVLVAGPQAQSNVNFRSGRDVANSAVVNVDADGSFCLYTDQAAHLLADVQGTYGDTGLRLSTVASARVLDTRSGPRPAAGSIVRVASGASAGASAVLVNLTVTDAQAAGYVTADRCAVLVAGPQVKSNVNFQKGVDVANSAVVNVDADGSFCIYTDQSAHLLADVQGVYQQSGGRQLATVVPRRILDTRSVGAVAAGSVTRVTTGAAAGVNSVLVNLTVTGAQSSGYVTADRCSVLVAGPQAKSNVNFQKGVDVANSAVVDVDADGSFCIYTDQRTDLVVDLQGVLVA